MKPGVRALGIAESYGGDRDEQRDGQRDRPRSTLAAAVVRADRVVDGLAYEACTVGGTDATAAVRSLLEAVGRPDVRYVLLGAVAPAWYNILDLSRIHEAADRPVIAVTFEESGGLEAGIRDAFSGAERDERLEAYRSLPDRRPLSVNDDTVYVRHVGCEASEAAAVVRAFTPEGGRPEPIRVARVAARAGNAYVGSGDEGDEGGGGGGSSGSGGSGE
ncbi:endonuclease dU [Halopiger thermotolerans]